MKFETNHPSCFSCSPTSYCAKCASAVFDLQEGSVIEAQLARGEHPQVTRVTFATRLVRAVATPWTRAAAPGVSSARAARTAR